MMSHNKMEIACKVCRGIQKGFPYGAVHTEGNGANVAMMLTCALMRVRVGMNM